MSRSTRPRLRPVEVIRVVGDGGALVTLLRDPERIAPDAIEVRPPLDQALAFMDGRHDPEQIARLVNRSSRGRGLIDAEAVDQLAGELEEAAMLDGPTATARRASLVAAFHASPVRSPTFAGSAYHAEPEPLAVFIDDVLHRQPSRQLEGHVRGLVAPHMDLWRAAEGYAAAYSVLADHLPGDLDTILVLGTCHAGMRSPFAFTKKDFRTPFGMARTDGDLVARVASKASVDIFSDEYKHQGEHSIEFQIVHLQHVLGDRLRDIRLIPVLCGIGKAQATRTDPQADLETARVLGALLEVLAARSVLVIAGADLAHVGPRFGDDEPLGPSERGHLAERDGESVRRLMQREAMPFFDHVTEDSDARRVCGTGPLYTLLRALETVGDTESELFGYTQHIDPDEGSIVSHASLAFVER